MQSAISDNEQKTIVVTGGAGFIGSALVRFLLTQTPHRVINIDKLTYAGNLQSLTSVLPNPRYQLVKEDIANTPQILKLLQKEKPQWIMHLAAESHVDRSINGAKDFIHSNVVGTFSMLEAARHYFASLSDKEKAVFRFHHISTDEVFGDLADSGSFFNEHSAYAPSSPYSASKASSDHLVNAWQRTYQLPTLITNCSNNYGPYHFPEKLIPLMIINALSGKPLPVYGDGLQVRDWLFVEDHVAALYLVVSQAAAGSRYVIGGNQEQTNLAVVEQICDLLDRLVPKNNGKSYRELIRFVPDRPGHDLRYAIDAQKIKTDLGWQAKEDFASGLYKTVMWYLDNRSWWQAVLDGSYQKENESK